jgi:proline iminopeptidase
MLDRLRNASVVLGEYAAETAYGLVRPDWRRSGATAQEDARRLPGDDLVPRPNWAATRAITIAAPPERVWPWLLQLGYGRGGWYSDMPWWKDPAGHTGLHSSATELRPEHQHLAVGDVLLDGANCNEDTGAWTVAELNPERAIVLFSRRILSGRELRDGQSLPRFRFACSWAFVLHPRADGTTRLLVRTRVDYRPSWMVRLVAVVRRGDTVMQRAMLLGIKRRVEANEPVEASP